MLEHYQRDVVTVRENTSATEIAGLMQQKSVGSVVVVDAENRPLGLITDRDLMIRVIVSGRTGDETPAVAIMSKPILTVGPDATLDEVIEFLQKNEIRRVPIVERERLIGILTLDDLLLRLTSELGELSHATSKELTRARRQARVAEIREGLELRLLKLIDRVEDLGGEAKESFKKEFESIREWLKDRFD